MSKYVVHSRFNWNGHSTLPPQRQVLQGESGNFDSWSTFRVMLKSDDDEVDGEFYNMEWMPYEAVFISSKFVFHTMADRLHVQLDFSRDDRNGVRAGDRDVFIPNNSIPGEYDYELV